MSIPVERLPFIAAIRQNYQEVMSHESPFHLGPCGGCGAPSFQQPCPLCGHYPMGERVKELEAPKISRETFERAIALSGVGGKDGNLATWQARSEAKTVAYKESPIFREKIEELLKRGQALEGLPSAGEIYDLVAIQRVLLLAPLPEPEPEAPPAP